MDILQRTFRFVQLFFHFQLKSGHSRATHYTAMRQITIECVTMEILLIPTPGVPLTI